MSSSKPTILLVPGAWHSPDLYAPMTDLLVAEGYEYIGISLVSVGADPALENWDPDVELIHKTVLGVLDRGKDVVLVVHSYGGLVGSEAMKGLGKKQRESEGKKGGVVRLVYICAFFLELGMHLQAVKNDQPHPWMKVDVSGLSNTPSCLFIPAASFCKLVPLFLKVLLHGISLFLLEAVREGQI